MLRIYACLANEHDIRFVAFAVGICLLSSLTALGLAKHVQQLEAARRLRWLLLTGYVTGVGIWATHFVAMLAYQPNLPTAYSPLGTTVSVVVSIAMAALGWLLRFSGRRHARFEAPLVMAAGIAAMHYIGMSALQTQGTLAYDPRSAVLALGSAGLLTALALGWDGKRPLRHGLLRAIALTLAICTLHFGSMAAVTSMPASGIAIPAQALPREQLSLGVAAAVLILLCIAVFAVTMDVRVRNTADEVSRMLSRDPLTGVLNTSAFDRTIKAMLSETPGRSLAILRIEPGNIVDSADRRQPGMKDRLLVKLARLLEGCSGVELVSRSSGSDFTVLLSAGDFRQDLGAAIRNVYKTLMAPIFVGGETFRLTPCIGTSRFPDHGSNWEELHHRAGFALYHARMSGRQSLVEYDPRMELRSIERNQLGIALRDALARKEFSLAYQPIACAVTGEVLGFEALLRWQRTGVGLVPPTTFIPIAEAEGLMPEIGQWALLEACRAAAGWPQALKVAVNLSATQFSDGELAGKVRAALAETGLPPSQLELEITEGLLIEDADQAVDILQELRSVGVRIAMDDFGTGFSSFTYFRKFPFDKVKIDQSFVKDMIGSRQAMAIVSAMIDLSRSLDIVVVAEGVETAEQLEVLAELGCHQVQGFVIGMPRPDRQNAHLTAKTGLPPLQCHGICGDCRDRVPALSACRPPDLQATINVGPRPMIRAA